MTVYGPYQQKACLGLVPEEPGLPDVIAQQRELLSRHGTVLGVG